MMNGNFIVQDSGSLRTSSTDKQQKRSLSVVITPNNYNNAKGKKNRGTMATTSNATTLMNQRMKVDKAIVDELLLVCGVIGTTTIKDEQQHNKIVPVTDCINWLQDLQRVLRRDDDIYRPISLLIGKWNIVTTKLLPLAVSCYYDTPLVLTILKILVILTKPLNAHTVTGGKLIINTKNQKSDNTDIIREQIKLRDNALQQSNMLMEYKRIITHHSSHNIHHKKKRMPMKKENTKSAAIEDNEQKKGGRNEHENEQEQPKGLLSIFVSLLAEPLSKSGTSRSNNDHLTIELVLHLFRNLLCIEPIMKGSTEQNNKSKKLHDELICLLKDELLLDILLVISSEMENKENIQYNLLVMELLHHLLRNHDPTLVAKNGNVTNRRHCIATTTIATTDIPNKKENDNIKNVDATAAKKGSKKKAAAAAGRCTLTASSIGLGSASSSSSLRMSLKRENQRLNNVPGMTTRHSHFGGTLVTKRFDGKNQYLSTTTSLGTTAKAKRSISVAGSTRNDNASSSFEAVANASIATKRKNRKTDPFIGSGKTFVQHSNTNDDDSMSSFLLPTTRRAQETLYEFCVSFLRNCYGPVMKSLKNEFRRDSLRLDTDNDKTIFFKLIWFFYQFYRVNNSNATDDKNDKKTILLEKESTSRKERERSKEKGLGQLIFTMDVFTFNLVLNSIDTFYQHKKHMKLQCSVALYNEMIHMLYHMYAISNDKTEKLMAMGLMDRIYYCNEPIDRTPKLLSKYWTAGTYTREYCCDIVELCHTTLKLLEMNHNEFSNNKEQDNNDKKKKTDAMSRMKENVLDFDVTNYFLRKYVSNQSVYMCTQLLRQYAVNSSRINDHIIAFFTRLCKIKISSTPSDDDDGNAIEGNVILSNNKVVTLEPILYNVQLFVVLRDIINDASIDCQSSTVSFALYLMNSFAKASENNPMLLVEALFQHVHPQRFCELSTNMYVNEELRMIAEREQLLEEHQRMLEEADDDDDNDGGTDDSREDNHGKVVDKTNGNDDNNKKVRSKSLRIRNESDDDGEVEMEWDANDDDDEGEELHKKKRKTIRRKKKENDSTADCSDIETDENRDKPEENTWSRTSFVTELKRKRKNNKLKHNDETAKTTSKGEEECKGDHAAAGDGHQQDGGGVLGTTASVNQKNGSNTEDVEEEEQQEKKKQKRIQKVGQDDDDSSDDDDFISSSGLDNNMAKSRKTFFDDDDDDE